MSIKQFGRITILLALVAIVFAATGCDEDTAGLEAERSAESYLQEGWDLFSSGRYEESIIPFNIAVDKEPQEPDAYNGRGWSWAKIGVLDNGRVNFETAIELGLETADPQAGLAVCLRDLEPVDYNAVITHALAALEISPDYELARHTSMDWHDLRLILAQAYFDTGLYEDANAQVVTLGGTANPVDIVDGVPDLEQVGLLALEIQDLGDLYAD